MSEIIMVSSPVRGGEEGEGVTDTETQEKSDGAWLGRREESLSEGISGVEKVMKSNNGDIMMSIPSTTSGGRLATAVTCLEEGGEGRGEAMWRDW